jgi:alanyl-tRNA synthetase
MSEQVGGKSGGNAAAAQGAGTHTDKVDAAVGLAQEFAAKLLLK